MWKQNFGLICKIKIFILSTAMNSPLTLQILIILCQNDGLLMIM